MPFQHIVSGSTLYLQGLYLELAVNGAGGFTNGSGDYPPPAGFHPGSSGSFGLTADFDGWDQGLAPTVGDYLAPGTAIDVVVVGYRTTSGGAPTTVLNAAGTTTDGSDDIGRVLGASTSATAGGALSIAQTTTFSETATYIRVDVTVTNVSASTLFDVRYMRSLDADPDFDLHGLLDAVNDVVANPDGTDSEAVVQATGPTSGAGLSLVALDDRARASVTGLGSAGVS